MLEQWSDNPSHVLHAKLVGNYAVACPCTQGQNYSHKLTYSFNKYESYPYYLLIFSLNSHIYNRA